MKTLQVVASINRDVGGPAVTVPALAAHLESAGVQTTVATLDYGVHGPQAAVAPATLDSMPATCVTRALRGWSPAFARRLETLCGAGVDVVHGHGLWMFPNVYARRCAQRARVPLVVSPRGMLDQWSLARSAGRKTLAWRLYEHRNLAAAAAFHATSGAEADAIRAAGQTQPIAVVPNGVDLAEGERLPGRGLLEQRFGAIRGRRVLLFMSRLHPKKGIDDLLRVWRALAARFAEWHLLVAGPDLDGYGAEVRRAAADLERGGQATFAGMLGGELKAAALAHAEFLALPTRAENFGLVIAEALAHGTPVLTTRAAPWEALVSHRCGWWIDAGEPALRAALEHVLACSPAELAEMGARGREFAAASFSWDRAAAQMAALYCWLLGKGDRPDCVVEGQAAGSRARPAAG